jgi:hypothetical protein
MKIHAISNFITPKIKQQIKDGLSVYKYMGLPVAGFVATDILKEKLKPKFKFCDKISI